MKKIFIIAMTALVAVTANADKKGFKPNWFVQLQGGIQMPYTPGDKLWDLTSPAFSVNLGRNITPLMSARIGMEGIKSKAYSDIDPTLKNDFKYATASFDAMLNVTNIFRERYDKAFNFYVLGGVGCNYSNMATTNSSHYSPNVRLGAQADLRLSKTIDVNLEYRADNTNDQFNGRIEQGTHDWYSSLLLGLNINFGYKKSKEKKVEAPVATTNNYDQAEAEAAAARAAAKQAEAEALARAEAAKKAKETAAKQQVVKQEPLKETVFFQIRQSDPTNDPVLDKVVAWCNKYPSKKVTVSGYADKGTGTAQVNKQYSEQRAQKVADALKAKGISADRISVSSYGDTVQPYAENNENRCTIIIGE